MNFSKPSSYSQLMYTSTFPSHAEKTLWDSKWESIMSIITLVYTECIIEKGLQSVKMIKKP